MSPTKRSVKLSLKVLTAANSVTTDLRAEMIGLQLQACAVALPG